MSSLQNSLFINNEYVDSQEKLSLKLISPVDDSVVSDRVQVAGRKDVDHAVACATAAFRDGPWASFTGQQRAACMNKFADLVEKHAETLAQQESLPVGRPVAGIRFFDIVKMAETFRYYAGWADKIQGESFTEKDSGYFKIVRYEPLGVCAGIVSWNATFLYVGWKVAPALAAGNTFIFKSSDKSPFGAAALGAIVKEAGFPPGVVQFITGGAETGSFLASHQGIRKISFTGSIQGGKAVQNAATQSNLKRVTLELGGKSPAIVFDDASFEIAVGSVGGGFLANSGQICVAASRVLVQESIAERFCGEIKSIFEAASKKLGSSPSELSTEHGPVADQMQFDRIMSYVAKGKSTATLVTGGQRKGNKGCFIEPTLFLNPDKDSPIWKEEIFGPVLTVKTFKTEAEAIELANDSIYGLAVSAKLESGGVSVNSPYLPELNTPFGGMKQSGNGKELGRHGLYE
ncbi:hypothetical protein ANO11243_071340 [Dothideomycetidae sp. 11243]|nr:hypothetical protein ANO11243_071340 [fungal sp. No.11243]